MHHYSRQYSGILSTGERRDCVLDVVHMHPYGTEITSNIHPSVLLIIVRQKLILQLINACVKKRFVSFVETKRNEIAVTPTYSSCW